jgi:prolyl 4-hydroxylase
MTRLESTWREWIVSNLRRNCSAESLVAEMVSKNFNPEFAKGAVAALLHEAESKGENAALGAVAGTAYSDNLVLSAASADLLPAGRLGLSNTVATKARLVSVVARLERPELLIFRGVLSDDECDELIRRSEQKLKRSTTVDPRTGEDAVISDRTSASAHFQINEDSFIASIDQRISELVNWPIDRGEGLQVFHYSAGGEYRSHFDFFPPGDLGSAVHMDNGGQRVGTLIMYLNCVEDGGETIFPKLGLAVVPQRGTALYFGYLNSRREVDPLTLHAGAPVGRGEKWIATKWLREAKRHVSTESP